MSCLVRIPSYNRTWHSMDVFNGLLKNINLEPLNNEEKSTLKVFAGGVVETTDEVPQSLANRTLAKKKKDECRIWKPKMDPTNIQHCRKAIQQN